MLSGVLCRSKFVYFADLQIDIFWMLLVTSTSESLTRVILLLLLEMLLKEIQKNSIQVGRDRISEQKSLLTKKNYC